MSTPPITTPVTLPKEILAMIIGSVPRSSLPNVCFTCRPLQEPAIIELYKNVLFCSIHPYHARRDYLCQTRNESSIYDISLFERTIVSSSFLRDIVRSVAIEWRHRLPNDVLKDIATINNLIGSQLETLYYYARIWDPKLPVYCHTSIRMSYSGGWERWSDIEGMKHIYAIFKTPTPRKVSLLRCGTLTESFQSGLSSMAATPRSSNVEYLSFLRVRRISADMVKIMTWPKALKAFYCEQKEWLPQDDLITVSQMKQLLSSQRDSLQQIAISRTNIPRRKNSWQEGFGDFLRHFPSLKRLALPGEYLLSSAPNIQNDRMATCPYYALPPNIEELLLDVEPWKVISKADPHLSDPAESYGKKLMQGITSHKQEFFPFLRRIVLWRRKPRFSKNHEAKEREVLKTKFNDEVGCSQDMEKLGNDFSCQYPDHPPCFYNDEMLYF